LNRQTLRPNSVNSFVLRLLVEPSRGNYLEFGAAKSLFGQLRVDANYFRRYVDNYADDDQILNTAVSFPIAFRKSVIYGAEAKVEVPHWNCDARYSSGSKFLKRTVPSQWRDRVFSDHSGNNIYSSVDSAKGESAATSTPQLIPGRP
jgi:hypothetical protein